MSYYNKNNYYYYHYQLTVSKSHSLFRLRCCCICTAILIINNVTIMCFCYSRLDNGVCTGIIKSAFRRELVVVSSQSVDVTFVPMVR